MNVRVCVCVLLKERKREKKVKKEHGKYVAWPECNKL